MSGQKSIPKHKITRAASIVGTGAKIGRNYAKYYAGKIAGSEDRESLNEANARDTYSAFSSLKGGPLKVAQMLSIDNNLLPQAYRDQFSQSFYNTPPLSYPLVVRTVRRSLNKGPTEVFDTFTREAVAAASIGQVHKATLDGKTYAVKVQYPGVAESLKSDLALIKPVAAKLFQMNPKSVDRYLQEAQARLLEECDYNLELCRSIELGELTQNLPLVRFPTYYPELSGEHVITMDWVDGEPIDRWLNENPSQKERDQIGQALWNFLHFQVLELRRFHADPHPGNFFVKDGHLWVLDFGCVKEIDEEFHQSYFSLLKPDLLDNEDAFQEKLAELELLLDSDSPREREILIREIGKSLELLSRPYRDAHFDFSDPEYIRSIYEMGEENRKNPDLKKIDTSRGSAHALYVNRAFFGLYNLMGRIGARVSTRIPEFV